MKVFSTHEILQETQERLQKVQAERDALVTQVEMLQKHIERVALCYHNNTGNEPSLSVFHRALDEAESAVFKEPSSFLAEIRAEAILGFATYIDSTGELSGDDCTFIIYEANQYAAKIQQGGIE